MTFDKKFFINFFIIISLISQLSSYSKKPFLARTQTKERLAKNYSFIVNNMQQLNTKTHSSALSIFPVFFSTFDNEKFSRIFMINNDYSSRVIGDDFINSPIRDIDPELIGAASSTNETLKIKTSANYFALRGIFQFSLGSLFSSELLKDFIIGIRTSFINSNHKSRFKNLSEEINDDIDNFFSRHVKNAKILNGNYSNNGLESVDITLESFYKGLKKRLFIYYYSGLSLPIPWDHLDNNNIFPTTIGNDGHLGLLMGMQAYCKIFSSEKVDFGGFLELENNFLIYRTKKRTFDLYNKQWSKYLPALNIVYPDNIKTIGEVTTLPVRVHPGFNLDISIGPSITFIKNDETRATLSGGYNLWYASDEYIELRDYAKYNDYSQLQYYGIKGFDNRHTASQSTIAEKSTDDTTKIPLTINLLDLNSGASAGGKSHTFFMRCMLESENYHGICGAWVEKGSDYYIQSRYGLWAGFGFLW